MFSLLPERVDHWSSGFEQGGAREVPRVIGFDAFRVAMPRGRRPESILVRLTGEDGVIGWGEVRSPEPGDAAWTDIEERIGPALLGVDWDRP
jgi:O-succinylbenzoate synthase